MICISLPLNYKHTKYLQNIFFFHVYFLCTEKGIWYVLEFNGAKWYIAYSSGA